MLILFLLTLLSLLLVTFLVVVKLAISDSSISAFSREEASSYECGFEQHSLSRIPLSIRYFRLTLVFLVFDLEIMLLIFSPRDISRLVSSSYACFVSLCFISVLFLGLLFE
jgi:NADH:ubiquinone oxidoreductase subunit 3 (subunit A)